MRLVAIGNITAKTSSTDPAENVGSYTYHATKKHAVVSTSNGWSFGYDANGNMNSYRGNTIAWTSYNLPSTINALGQSSQFWYGPNRNRWKQVASYPSGTETTIYVGGLLEKVTVPSGVAWRHYIGAGSAKVVYTRWSSGSENTRYVTADHLNSSTVVMDSSGNSLVNLSFAAFGARRGSGWSGTPSSGEWTQINNSTRRGYTGHEHLDNLNIIHMNGRVFDPALGRFLSADPLMPGMLGSQAPNRYAYVGNRPLSLMDPSGFAPRNGNALKQWREFGPNEGIISPWEEAAMMRAQLAWHQTWGMQMSMYGGIPPMQAISGVEWANRYVLAGFRGASSGSVLSAMPLPTGPHASINIDCNGTSNMSCDQEPDRWSGTDAMEAAQGAANRQQAIDQFRSEFRDWLKQIDMMLLQIAQANNSVEILLPSGEYSISADQAREVSNRLRTYLSRASFGVGLAIAAYDGLNGEWGSAGIAALDALAVAGLFHVPVVGPGLALLFIESGGSGPALNALISGGRYGVQFLVNQSDQHIFWPINERIQNFVERNTRHVNGGQ